MSEMKFYCPRCNQKIQCEEQWGGLKIQCPACQVEIVVPQTQTAPAAPVEASLVPQPPAPAQPRLAINRTQPEHKPAPPPAPAPTRARFGPKPPVKSNAKKQAIARYVKFGVASIAVCVGCYFGFGFVSNWQKKLNEKSAQAAKNSDGGEFGHVATLNAVLDATDPNKFSRYGAGGAGESLQRARDVSRMASGAMPATPSDTTRNLPVIAPTWTLDVNAATIPEARANGTISGGSFVADTASLSKSKKSYVLALKQGTGASVDKAILIYLIPKPGAKLVGNTWTVASDSPDTSVQQVAKLWKKDPGSAPQQKSYRSGFAMKLELGQLVNGSIPGKIFIALPDDEKSVVAGKFSIIAAAASSGMDMEEN